MNDATFWLSLVLIAACLLLCLQKEKRVVPLIREAGCWAWYLPVIAMVLTVVDLALFGSVVSIESVVNVYATVFAGSTVIYFLFRLSG